MTFKNRFALLITTVLPALSGVASDTFTFTPRGRIHFDGAVFSRQDAGLVSGVAIPEVRIGLGVGYGKWSGVAEMAYGFGKVALRDAFIQYAPDSCQSVRAGYFITQFGLGAATAWSTRPTLVTPTADSFFDGAPRSLGVQYTWNGLNLFASAGVTFASNTITTEPNRQGRVSWGGSERIVWRPLRNPSALVAQVGFSTWAMTPEHTRLDDGRVSPGYFKYSVRYPVETDRVTMQTADISDAKWSLRLTPEWLVAKGRLAFEGQYYYMAVPRSNRLDTYEAQGVYALLRGLAIGKGYAYSGANAGLAQPAPGSLEITLGYDWLKASDRSAGILGGYSTDWSATASYFFNKYILARLRVGWTGVHGSAVTPDTHVATVQARLQLLF